MKKTLFILGAAVCLSFGSTGAFAEANAEAKTEAAAGEKAGNAKKGAKVFRKCKACHSVGEGAKNKVGPILNGVVGRKAGVLEGYEFSDAMKKAGADGMVWDEATLKKFLTNPKDAVPGTKMAFSGIKKEKKLRNLIAFLKEQK